VCCIVNLSSICQAKETARKEKAAAHKAKKDADAAEAKPPLVKKGSIKDKDTSPAAGLEKKGSFSSPEKKGSFSAPVKKNSFSGLTPEQRKVTP